MEHRDIFRQLLQTEAAARSIHDEAAALEAAMTRQLERRIEAQREQAYEKADAQIAQAEARVIREADAQISRLDEDARRHLAQLKEVRSQNVDKWVQQIFLAATHQET